MKHKLIRKRLLAIMLGLSMLMPSASAPEAKSAKPAEPATAAVLPQTAKSGREQINFNRSWKFIRGDMPGAEAAEYDDSAWVDIGIPHNFSIPYEMTAQFYVGYGWYRKEFDVPAAWKNKKIELEFEGVFQVAEIFVNGEAVGTHEGGYSGFVYDITDYLREGKNLLAVRVNNIWQHDLAPRGGDHQFTGGIYRDVYLNVTEDVHVAWYGTYVTTPDLTNPAFDASAQNIDFTQFPSDEAVQANIDARRSNVRVQTEVVNASGSRRQIQVRHTVRDENGSVAAEFSSGTQTAEAGETIVIDARSEQISGIRLWSPDDPYLYTVETTVLCGQTVTDTYESTFGFRWAQYRNDGFYLNGEKILLDGANAHQDHAGFADAVTNEGFYRDVAMIKECGMNFIRGSHYPHDPSYADACDKLGILFWSECNFWGMGGCAGKDEDAVMNAADWNKDAYPQNPNDEAAFEQSCMDSLEAMIRINRNHPSVINWSMGNEVFFTSGGMENNGTGTGPKAKALVNKMRNFAHQLDPTRKAGMGGCQRGGYDSLEVCDIAGYNGDGGKITNTNMPNIVAEYGSKVQDRPGEFRPFYDQIQGSSPEEFTLKQNSAGLSLWCAFHHGTIGGDGLAKMGIIDYYRLPLQSWYWYREKNTGVKAESAKSGTAAYMELSASDTEITDDGQKDAMLTVTMKDENGNWVSDTREVTLTVTDGPGIFPGGKSYTFTPNKSIRDGKAAIEFRSFYAGETTITAQAKGLPDAQIKITTKDTAGAEAETEPEGFYDASLWGTVTSKIDEPFFYGGANAASGRPTFPSSSQTDGSLATDGNPLTSWTAEKSGSGEYFLLDLEFALYLYKIKLDFANDPWPFRIETALDKDNGPWTEAVSYTEDTIASRPEEESLNGTEARYVKITFTEVPEEKHASLSEIAVYGNISAQAPQYTTEGVYLSDAADFSKIITGWGNKGKDVSCEGSPITVGGITYEKGIGLHADSSIPFDAAGKYTRITGTAGIDNEVTGGNALFRIYADDVLIYEKELSGGDADKFSLSISGVQKLRLETDANGSDSQDHTDWADVKLLPAGRNISKSESGLSAFCTGMTSGLHAGTAYQTFLSITNTKKEERDIQIAAQLYDKENNLISVSRRTVKPGAQKTVQEELWVPMPSDITGYSLAVQLWDKETLEPLSKGIRIYADKEYLKSDGVKTVWTKIDGEADSMQKEGNWFLWSSADAYEGTETCAAEAGLSVSHDFTGNYVRIGAKVDSSQRGADVYIDGTKAGSFSTKADDTSTNVYREVWASERLSSGAHTVKLVSIGKFGLDYMEFGTEQQTGFQPEDGAELRALKALCAGLFRQIASGEIQGFTTESRKAAAEIFENALALCTQDEPDEASCKAAAEALAEAVLALVHKEPESPETPVQPKPDPPPTPDPRPIPDPQQKLPAKGFKFQSGSLQYQITKSDAVNGTASVVKLLKKNSQKITIPAAVTRNGYTFKVTSVAKNAFRKNKKLKKVILGANITDIGSGSFKQCSSLKKITIQSKKAPKIGSKAFSGIYKKCTVTVPKKFAKKQLRKLKKSMKSAGTQIAYKQKG